MFKFKVSPFKGSATVLTVLPNIFSITVQEVLLMSKYIFSNKKRYIVGE